MNHVRFFVFTLPALLGLGLATTSAQAATELYLQFDPALHGSAKESTHPSWILVDSYTLGDAAGPTGAMGAGQASGAGQAMGTTGKDVKGDKGASSEKGSATDKGGLPTKGAAGEGLGEKGGAGDKAGKPTKMTFVTSDLTVLAELRADIAKAVHFKTAILDVRKTTKGSAGDYVKITMTDAMISSTAIQGAAMKGKPNAVSFTLTFVKEVAEYSQGNASGGRTAGQAVPAGWDVTTAKAE
jgi:type VI protein secretion system component Hcp